MGAVIAAARSKSLCVIAAPPNERVALDWINMPKISSARQRQSRYGADALYVALGFCDLNVPQGPVAGQLGAGCRASGRYQRWRSAARSPA
jgi:hypothetical protein